jgi:hypothetical protein
VTKVVGVFVRFRAPLHPSSVRNALVCTGWDSCQMRVQGANRFCRVCTRGCAGGRPYSPQEH